MPDAQPRSAYIHVPFCARRCGYCSFTLVAGRGDLVGPYLEALGRELSWLGTSREVDTLYFGGGTPTELKGAALERLLGLVLEWHPLATGHEFTVEANPRDVDAATARILSEHGVTRVSLGAQSFRPEKLRALERDHTARDIERAVELIRARGMQVSLDLIFAAPGEALGEWEADLEAAIALAPDHVSTYGLTYERGAQFWNRRHRGELSAADEETERAMYESAIDHLTAAGFEHYEVSNFARWATSPFAPRKDVAFAERKPTKRCRHNEAYWLGEEYFAAGPGAARYVDGMRSINHRSTTTFITRVLAGKSPVAESEKLSPRDRALEVLVFALRRLEGVERRWIQQKTGFIVDAIIGERVKECTMLGLLNDDGQHIRLTRDGLLVSDSIFGRLLAAACGAV